MIVPLPSLVQRPSPNHSSRNGTPIRYLVWHSTIGHYEPSIAWLCNPRAQASAHLVVREDGGQAAQLVHLHEKAWHCEAWNPQSVGVEHASLVQGFTGREQALRSARIFAWLCHTFQIPPVHGIGRPAGIVRHRDLGVAGGGHLDGPSDSTWFGWYLPQVAHELDEGGFRKTWATL